MPRASVGGGRSASSFSLRCCAAQPVTDEGSFIGGDPSRISFGAGHRVVTPSGDASGSTN